MNKAMFFYVYRGGREYNQFILQLICYSSSHVNIGKQKKGIDFFATGLQFLYLTSQAVEDASISSPISRLSSAKLLSNFLYSPSKIVRTFLAWSISSRSFEFFAKKLLNCVDFQIAISEKDYQNVMSQIYIQNIQWLQRYYTVT